MHIKFDVNNFIFYVVCLPQLGSVPAAYAAVSGRRLWLAYHMMTSLRYVPYVRCVRCVGCKPRLSYAV